MLEQSAEPRVVTHRAGRALLVGGAKRGIVVEQAEQATEPRPADPATGLIKQAPVGGRGRRGRHERAEWSRVGRRDVQGGQLELADTAERADPPRDG